MQTNLSVILDYLHSKILDTHPPLDPILFIFMQFLAKFGLIWPLGLAPHLQNHGCAATYCDIAH